MSIRKAILVLILAVLFIDILRETGVLTLNRYKSVIKTQMADNWNNSTLTLDYKKDDSLWLALKPQLSDSCNFDHNIRNVKVYTYLGDVYVGDPPDRCPRLNIEVTDFRPGVIWTPLFKSTSFSASGRCSNDIQILSENEEKGFRKLYGLHGTFTITGHITITGLCTYKEAKLLLKKYIVQQFAAQGQSQLRQQ